MPTPTQVNAERINELIVLFQNLGNKLDQLGATTEKDYGRIEDAVRDLGELLDTLKNDSNERRETAGRHDERIKTLEKRDDRKWQVWLAIGGAGLALLVALLKK